MRHRERHPDCKYHELGNLAAWRKHFRNWCWAFAAGVVALYIGAAFIGAHLD